MTLDPTNWTDLKAALATWLVRDDLTDVIPQAIALVEREFQRSVFTPDREAATTLAATSESVDLPADFWGVRTLYVDGDSLLVQVTPERLRELYPDGTGGTPRHFAIERDVILLGPVPTASSLVLTYWQTIPALGDEQATNWLLTAHPDLYLAATLAWLFEYTQHFTSADRWSARAAAIIDGIARRGRRTAHSGPLRASPPVVQVSRLTLA